MSTQALKVLNVSQLDMLPVNSVRSITRNNANCETYSVEIRYPVQKMVLQKSYQCWIHDFLRGAQSPKVGVLTYYFVENCMKMKEFGPRGGCVSLVSPWTRHCITCLLRLKQDFIKFLPESDDMDMVMDIFWRFGKIPQPWQCSHLQFLSPHHQ